MNYKLLFLFSFLTLLAGCSNVAVTEVKLNVTNLTNVINQSGNFTFVNQTNVEGGGSLWTNSSPDIYYDLGNVGIGTNSPTKTLHVDGDIEIDTATNVFMNIDGAGSVSYIDIDNTNTGTTGFRFLDTGSARWIFGSDGGDSDKFKISGSSSFSGANYFTIDRSNGNIGIGIEDPDANLHIATGTPFIIPNAGADEFIFEKGSGTAGMTLATAANTAFNIYFADPDSNAIGRLIYNHGSDSMQFGTNGDEVVRIHSNGGMSVGDNYVATTAPVDGMIIEGDVGIGTTSPTHTLHVDGDQNLTGTLYYGALVAQSPHAFLEDESGYTRILLKAVNGDCILMYFDNTLRFERNPALCNEKKVVDKVETIIETTINEDGEIIETPIRQETTFKFVFDNNRKEKQIKNLRKEK